MSIQTERPDMIESPSPTAPETTPLINGLDMSQFSRSQPDTSHGALPNIDLALVERCVELGSSAAACVKSIRRRGLS
ncbi:MAG: hypothetical protein K2X77_14260 [Candidatus Obscuribacterales bacterium]|nr:hypothetical protein [Candidatus Obscuribacterales bacterium]